MLPFKEHYTENKYSGGLFFHIILLIDSLASWVFPVGEYPEAFLVCSCNYLVLPVITLRMGKTGTSFQFSHTHTHTHTHKHKHTQCYGKVLQPTDRKMFCWLAVLSVFYLKRKCTIKVLINTRISKILQLWFKL